MSICISNCMEVFVIPCEGLNDNGAAYQRGGNVNCDKLYLVMDRLPNLAHLMLYNLNNFSVF